MREQSVSLRSFHSNILSQQQMELCIRRAHAERSDAFAALGRRLWAALTGPAHGARFGKDERLPTGGTRLAG